MAKEIGEQDFQKEVIEASASKPILVDFWAPWCGPCQMMMPTLAAVSEELGESASVVKVNVDESINLARQYGISGIPSLKIFRHGKIVKEFVGVTDKQTLVEALKVA